MSQAGYGPVKSYARTLEVHHDIHNCLYVLGKKTRQIQAI